MKEQRAGAADRLIAGVEPEVRWLAEEIQLQHLTVNGVSAKAGVSHQTVAPWFHHGSTPNLSNFKAMLGVLGYELAIVPIDDDPDVEYRVTRLLAQLKLSDEDRFRLREFAAVSSGKTIAEVASELLSLVIAKGPVVLKRGKPVARPTRKTKRKK